MEGHKQSRGPLRVRGTQVSKPLGGFGTQARSQNPSIWVSMRKRRKIDPCSRKTPKNQPKYLAQPTSIELKRKPFQQLDESLPNVRNSKARGPNTICTSPSPATYKIWCQVIFPFEFQTMVIREPWQDQRKSMGVREVSIGQRALSLPISSVSSALEKT